MQQNRNLRYTVDMTYEGPTGIERICCQQAQNGGRLVTACPYGGGKGVLLIFEFQE